MQKLILLQSNESNNVIKYFNALVSQENHYFT